MNKVKLYTSEIVYRVMGNLEEAGLVPTRAVMDMWDPNVRMVEEEENTISIFDIIGGGLFFDGVTVKRIDGALRRIGSTKDVTVNINSPGGNMFEGIAIYNRLRQHRGAIKVNVLGIAASAASAIAMAGDEIIMNTGSQMMVHNPVVGIAGDYRDLAEAAAVVKGFRDSAAEIYVNRTNLPQNQIHKMMNDETFMTAQQAVDKGFATDIAEFKTREERTRAAEANNHAKAMEVVKVAMAKEGLTRKERSAIFKELGIAASVTDDNPPAASVTGDPGNAGEVLQALKTLQNTIGDLKQ